MAAHHGKLVKSRQKQGLSGLGGRYRSKARSYARKIAVGSVKHAAAIHYSQMSNRWSGIAQKLNGLKGEYPSHADCSSFTTWILWVVLVNHFGLHPDIVNGQLWREGYTGTQVDKGVRVRHRRAFGDLIFYGDQGGGVPKHVAMYVGWGMVISHGSEGGPYLCRINYRSDYASTRRYI